MKWKVEKSQSYISALAYIINEYNIGLLMIFDDNYGHMHSICVYNWDYNEIEKHAKNALGQFLPTRRIHWPELSYLITNIYNSILFDINNKF